MRGKAGERFRRGRRKRELSSYMSDALFIFSGQLNDPGLRRVVFLCRAFREMEGWRGKNSVEWVG